MRFNLSAHRAVHALAATAVATTLASVLSAQVPATARRRVPMDSTQRDSTLRLRVAVSSDDIARMIGELLASRQMEERLAMELRNDRTDKEKARELEAQLSALVRRNSGLMSAIRMQCVSEEVQPAGYMGINFEGIEMRRVDGGPVMYFLGDRPTVVSVEPGSPAQRAGIEASDEVVTIAGVDARKPIPLAKVLTPGAKVSLRVTHDGKPREVMLTIEKRPDEYGSPCSNVDDVVGGFRYSPQTTFIKRMDGPMAGALPRSPSPQGGLMPSEAPNFGYAFVTPFPSGAGNLIGGAAFVALNADWRETLGVDKGLLVSNVAPGSPAQSAGLKAADVVLWAGDMQILKVSDLWRAVNGAGKDGVTLKLQRAKKEITIVLKPAERR